MALRRAILTRATLASRYRFSLPCIHQANGGKDRDSEMVDFSLQKRSFGSYSSPGFNPTTFRCSPFSGRPMAGSSFYFSSRLMSTDTISPPTNTNSAAAEYMNDDVQTAVDAALVSAAPAMTEVAIAAADSALPVAALQYLIGNVHLFTGCNWWVSIVVTTLLVRGLTLPLEIQRLKSGAKMRLLSPHLADLQREMQDKLMDPLAAAERQQRMLTLHKEFFSTLLGSFKGLLQGPILFSFYLAITNMVEKIPSFKYGGAYWFTDLTTPDGLFIFPALTAISLLAIMETQFNVQVGGQINSSTTRIMKNFSRVFSVLTIYFTMNHSQALCCYWVTNNAFSFVSGLVCKSPIVKKFLGIPDLPVTPSSTVDSPPSFVEAMKTYRATNQVHAATPCMKPEKLLSHEQGTDSGLVCSQGLKSLEKQVKGRKNKRR